MQLTEPLPPLSQNGSGNGNSGGLDKILNHIFELQSTLIDRDATIHDLHRKALTTQEQKQKKDVLKKGFGVVDTRHVDTSTPETVLKDALHHIIYTLCSTFGGDAGVVMLDVPYNANIGATNTDLKVHIALATHWGDVGVLPENLREELETPALYRDILAHGQAKLFGEAELTQMREQGVDAEKRVKTLMTAPIVIDSMSIAAVVMVNGTYGPEDPKLLTEVLAELWTPNVQPLIGIALEASRKRETEEKLVSESQIRDEIILTLDHILDEVVRYAIKNTPQGKSTSEHLWRLILQRVSNYFEEYFSADSLVAVTNTEANFRMQNVAGTATGSNAGKDLDMVTPLGGSRSIDENLTFIHYVFSQSVMHIRKTKMRHLSHPKIQNSKMMKMVLLSGEPYYTPTSKCLKLPSGHMKMTNTLLVPIIFCDEPVGMLGLANGEFDMSAGRILQSVFNTFWSMIVKATIMSESQKVLNAAIPSAISERMQRGEKIADSYEHGTCLFADIVGFTSFTQDLEPIEVVEFSNLIFARLDKLVVEFELEKIKVIGDCYMVAGGLKDKAGSRRAVSTSIADQSQMREMIMFAMRILEESTRINEGQGQCSKRIRDKLLDSPLQFRVGIGYGPLTAGVFGTSKVRYDVIGATVNLSSRLESSGMAGCVQVSDKIYNELCMEEAFEFDKRKPICLKGLGLVQSYFVRGTFDSLRRPVVVEPRRLGGKRYSVSSVPSASH